MRRLLLLPALLLLSLLAGCDGQSRQTPLRPLTEAELRPYYVDSPTQPLPEYTAFTLGEFYTPRGTVANWKEPKVVPLYSRFGQNLVPAAQLQPDGRITGAAPLKSARTENLQAIFSIGGANAWLGGLCVVDGLKEIANINVAQPEASFFILRFSDLQQRIQPLTSPVPTERVLGRDLTVYDQQLDRATSRLVYASEDVTVQGEQRCVSGYEQGDRISVSQDNIHVNLKLTKGWNALVSLSTSSYGSVTRVADVVWTTVPPEAIERWK
ncbi:hypothetical protein ACI3L1_02480 [Deinococcus sp. SM5_A1]